MIVYIIKGINLKICMFLHHVIYVSIDGPAIHYSYDNVHALSMYVLAFHSHTHLADLIHSYMHDVRYICSRATLYFGQ